MNCWHHVLNEHSSLILNSLFLFPLFLSHKTIDDDDTAVNIWADAGVCCYWSWIVLLLPHWRFVSQMFCIKSRSLPCQTLGSGVDFISFLSCVLWAELSWAEAQVKLNKQIKSSKYVKLVCVIHSKI